MVNADKTEENASMPKGIFRQETTKFGDMGDSFWDTRRRKSAGSVHFIGNQGKFSAIANHYPPDIMNIGAYGTLGKPRKSISSSVAESLPQTLKKGG